MRDRSIRFIKASAGTGKTTKIIEEIKEIPKEELINTFVISFSNSAVNEVKERLIKDGIINVKDPQTLVDGIKVMTIHSFALMLLNTFRWEKELPDKLQFIEGGDVNLLWKEAVESYISRHSDELTFIGERRFRQYVNTLGETLFYYIDTGMIETDESVVLSEEDVSNFYNINYAYNDIKYPKDKGDAYKSIDKGLLRKVNMVLFNHIKRIGVDYYLPLIYERGVVSYDGAVYLVVKYFEGKRTRELLEKLKEYGIHIKHIFVDEAQDTDILQLKMIVSLLPFEEETDIKTFWIVGDEKQSIYEWRNAMPQGFVRLYEEFKNRKYTETESMDESKRIKNRFLYEQINSYINVLNQDDKEESKYNEFINWNKNQEKKGNNCLASINSWRNLEEFINCSKKYGSVGILVRSRNAWRKYKTYLSNVNPDRYRMVERAGDSLFLRYIEYLLSAKDSSLSRFVKLLLPYEWGINPDGRTSLKIGVDKGYSDYVFYSVDDVIEYITKKDLWKFLSVKDRKLVLSFLAYIESASLFSNMDISDMVRILREAYTKPPEFYGPPKGIEVATIHATKGLTYDTVVILGAKTLKGSSFGTARSMDDYFIINDVSNITSPNIKLDYVATPIVVPKEAENDEFLIAREKKRRRECKNLFYVAVTRPQSSLLLIDVKEKRSGNRREIVLYSVMPEDIDMTKRGMCNSTSKLKNSMVSNEFFIPVFIKEEIEKMDIKEYYRKTTSITKHGDDYSGHNRRIANFSRPYLILYGIIGHYLAEKNLVTGSMDYSEDDEYVRNFIEKNNIIDTINANRDYSNLNKNGIVKNEVPIWEIDEEKNILKRGIMDILIERDREFNIVEFKFLAHDDVLEEYKHQLKEYYRMLSETTNKEVLETLIAFQIRE